ncbi:hypothetical protein KAM448_40550 [Aeromonas caviae]|nr:hypothetical protein KAM448_40550 [Aeromonas caviae]
MGRHKGAAKQISGFDGRIVGLDNQFGNKGGHRELLGDKGDSLYPVSVVWIAALQAAGSRPPR